MPNRFYRKVENKSLEGLISKRRNSKNLVLAEDRPEDFDLGNFDKHESMRKHGKQSLKIQHISKGSQFEAIRESNNESSKDNTGTNRAESNKKEQDAQYSKFKNEQTFTFNGGIDS